LIPEHTQNISDTFKYPILW